MTRARWPVILALAIAFLIAMLGPIVAFAQPVPPAALKYRAELTRAAQQVWGLRAPIAMFAAQIHQESGWRHDVCSPYACGLTQFTGDTAEWIDSVYGAELGGGGVFNPRWAIRALVRYDRHLFDRLQGHTDCDRHWLALRAYNGGLGHIQMERKHAADPLSRASVDLTCGKARRSVKHCAENLGYPDRIINRHQPRYALWGASVCKGD